jgi:hypothetical protein
MFALVGALGIGNMGCELIASDDRTEINEGNGG